MYFCLIVNIFQKPIGISNSLKCCFENYSFGFFPIGCRGHLIIVSFFIIIGFLCGWIIHSLIRKHNK